MGRCYVCDVKQLLYEIFSYQLETNIPIVYRRIMSPVENVSSSENRIRLAATYTMLQMQGNNIPLSITKKIK